MADNELWPKSKFSFTVDFGNGMPGASFQEVTGLDAEAQMIEYRHGDSPIFATQKMPGLVKFRNITLKRGILLKDNTFFDWYAAVKMNTVKRTTVTIKLLDEAGTVAMTWTLQNAWITKVSGTDLQSEGNEIAVETIEIAHEGLKIANS